MTEHTPTPWVCHSGMVWKQAEPGFVGDTPIAFMDREPGNGTLPVERDENAKYITVAVNSHKRLVRALEKAYKWVGRRTPITGEDNITLEALRLRHDIRKLLTEVRYGSV